jgi:EAL domain-containing protein (putative c-di-GMP-specific phosphodiesterase class I)
MVDVIDNIVLEAVAHELQVDSKVKIAMNISGNTANNDAWFSRATHLLPDYGTASRLIVEITESSREYHMDQMVRFTDQLRWLGCQISIDDFGAGYTSFSQLKMVSADYLKIDGVFIRNILTSPDSQLFIRVFIDFARAYGIKTVAEFVETGEIAKSLIDLGVDYLQGYYFSRALDYRPWVTSDLL